ncbi:MAG: family 20 glycosylhydrolase [Bacteroidales bacterium]|nr:family 20 glycosylhydrolase [Bacteroidales bacterium]
MKNLSLLFVALPIVLLVCACKETVPTDLTRNALIPHPREVTAGGEAFRISGRTRISYQDPALTKNAGILAGIIGELSDLEVETENFSDGTKRNRIHLLIEAGDHGLEGYRMRIEKRRMVISAPGPEGIYRGITTFGQMIAVGGVDLSSSGNDDSISGNDDSISSNDASISSNDVRISGNNILVPTGEIRDWPEYSYRGTMLDVSRHFFAPGIVKRYIDQLTLYKLNYLHLHLADDQGWRIEIKSWPKLTSIGGSTEVGGGEGGFYTQEEYRDLVAYAAERYITIVPEIDMPGHTNAALASYADLNCDGVARELYTGTRVGFSTLCTDKEITYRFVNDVVREISEMTPGPYFHMGGDESHVTELPDYIYFVNRVREIVRSHGKTMMGWDEISHADLSEGDIAQYWASSANAERAVEKGARLLISPAQKCYLDMKYDSTTALGLNWAAYIEVDDAYNWQPVTLDEGIGRDDILGIESPLWAETIETLDDIEYLAFPRLIGHAEIGWSSPLDLSWENYHDRLQAHGPLLDRLGVNYYRSDRVW